MRCPFCKEDDDKVIDSRAAENARAIRRRRVCQRCKRRFTTYERIESDAIKLSVIKRDGTRVPYDRTRILEGIRHAAYKRPVTAARLEQVVDEVEEQLFQRFEKEVSSHVIGELTASVLRRVDKVAYVRFASVYRQFEDVGDFIGEAQDVIERAAEDVPGQQNLFEGNTPS